MTSVQEVFDLALEIDMISLAHRIFWAISKGHVTTGCASEKLDAIEYDEQAIAEIVQSNLLSIGKIKLFVVETSAENLFAFYYAENVLTAFSLHQELFRERPKKVTLANHLMTKLFYFNNTEASSILYEHRKKVVAYPYYLGHARAGEHIFHQFHLKEAI